MRRLAPYVSVFAAAVIFLPAAQTQSPVTLIEAPTGFDDQTNGFLTQDQFNAVRGAFEEQETREDGLGPVYNARSCAECHQNPVTGAVSQITELRAGHFDPSLGFVDHPGGSLINDRAIDAGLQERVQAGYEVRTLRTSLNTLGDGFVEAIDDSTLAVISNRQPANMRGQLVQVPVLEAGGTMRSGRFGWKNQHASLVSFSADAYLNEMGITSTLQATENTSNGRTADDGVPDPEDDGADVEAFASFMRSTKAPPRDAVLAATPAAQAGSSLFDSVGCATCHVRTIRTAPAGTLINGGAFTVPPALGSKIIHPFSDFLLHDVGTGDGIVQNGGPSTRTKLRTAPLWGLRTRTRLTHDGRSLTLDDAIRRHRGEASNVTFTYQLILSDDERSQLLTFLESL